jgi:hypothetical protein
LFKSAQLLKLFGDAFGEMTRKTVEASEIRRNVPVAVEIGEQASIASGR